MTAADRNKATLVHMFENLGPDVDRFKRAYRDALTDDVTWYMQGWPHVIGIEELDAQLDVLNALLGVEANPILEWRMIDAQDDRVYFERRGSFAGKEGETIATWDIFGIFEFNEDGKIFRIRDYFDSTEAYESLRSALTDEQIAMINKVAVHPLREDYEPMPEFYRQMREQAAQLTA
jgi:limonene-1,2-epoxide hydrolase